MTSLLLRKSSRRTTADPSGRRSGGSCSSSSSSNNNKRRRRCFSSVPRQAAATPPSPFLSAASSALGGAASASAPALPRRSSPPPSSYPAAGRAAYVVRRATASRAVKPHEAGGEEEEEGEERLLPSRRRRRRRPQGQRAGAGAGSSRARRARGLLSRATTAVAVTAAAVVAVSAPIGVGALLTQEECEQATLRGTPAALMESPRPDKATEAAAAGIDRTVVASQATYDRMVADQWRITREEGREVVPFRNRWSDHVWLGTATVTFPDIADVALFKEGSPPEFNCMNEYYGLSFERGDAVATPAPGTLTADKVLNWDLLGADYLALEGIGSFVPTDVTTVTSSTSLVAAREDIIAEELGSEFSEDSSTPQFHYFLSVPAEDVDPSDCPEPCTGEVVSYYWSQAMGSVYLLDRTSAVAETRPCWLELFEAVADGPPADGVGDAVWEATEACTAGLLQVAEDAKRSGDVASSAAAAEAGEVDGDGDGGGDGGGDGDGGGGGGGGAVAAAVLVPTLLVFCAVVAFGLLRHQKVQRLKKEQTTDEAWGERKLRPPAGRFKLGANAAVEGGDGGIARLKSFPPPRRVFTDVSIDEPDDDGVGSTAAAVAAAAVAVAAAAVAAAGEARRDEEEGRGWEDEDEDMIYPM